MSDVSKLKLMEIANRIPLFKELNLYEKEQVISIKNIVKIIKKDTKFIIFGDQDDSFYILLSGVASVIIKDRQIAEIHGGQFVGEVGFICGEARTASIIANTDLITFCIDREKFSHLPIRLRDKIKDKVINGLVNRVEHMNGEIEQLNRTIENLEIAEKEMLDVDPLAKASAKTKPKSTTNPNTPSKEVNEGTAKDIKPIKPRAKKATW